MKSETDEIYKILEGLENYIDNVARHMIYLEKKINRLDRELKLLKTSKSE